MVVTIKPKRSRIIDKKARAEAYAKAGTAGIPTGYGEFPISQTITKEMIEEKQQTPTQYISTITPGGAQLITATKTYDVSQFGKAPGTAVAQTATGERTYFLAGQQLYGTYEPATQTLRETKTTIYDVSKQGKPTEIISFQGRVPQATTLTEVQISPTYAQLVGTTRVEIKPTPSEMGGMALAEKAHRLFYPEESITTQETANIPWQERLSNLGFLAKPKITEAEKLPQGIPISTYTAATQEEISPFIRYKRETQQIFSEGKFIQFSPDEPILPWLVPAFKMTYFFPEYKTKIFETEAQQLGAKGEYGTAGTIGMSALILGATSSIIKMPEYMFEFAKGVSIYSATTKLDKFVSDIRAFPSAFSVAAQEFGFQLKTQPETTIGSTAGLLIAPMAWQYAFSVIRNPFVKFRGIEIEQTRIFDIAVLEERATFPTAKSVPEAVARFKVPRYIEGYPDVISESQWNIPKYIKGQTETQYPTSRFKIPTTPEEMAQAVKEGRYIWNPYENEYLPLFSKPEDILGAHTTAEPFTSSKIGTGTSREQGLFIAPAGEASPYFLRAGAMEYPFESISLNPLSMFKFPKVIQIAYGEIARYPPKILKSSWEASNVWITEQAGGRKAYISRGFETGMKTEIEAIIPPTSEIKLVKDNMDWIQKIKGYKYYVTYKGVAVPIKTYELLNLEGKGTTATKSYLKVMREVESSYKTPQQNLYEYLGGIKGSPYYRGESYAGGYSYAQGYSYKGSSYRASSYKAPSYVSYSYYTPQYSYAPYSYRIPLSYRYPTSYKPSSYKVPSYYPPSYYPPSYRYPAPPYVPPPVIPPMIPFGYMGEGKGRRDFMYKPRAFKYAPSLAGISLGIKIGKAPKGALSGIGIRGIPGMSNKQLKKFKF